eukprot:Gb_36365 [translate_table: standard]
MQDLQYLVSSSSMAYALRFLEADSSCHVHYHCSSYYKHIDVRLFVYAGFIHHGTSSVRKQSKQFTQKPKTEWEFPDNNVNKPYTENLAGVMDKPSISIDSSAFVSLLQTCTNMKSVKQVHGLILVTGLEQDVFLGTKLVTMYAKCGGLVDARIIFDNVPRRNLFSYNIMIGGYAKEGQCEETLKVYHQMQRAGIQPDEFTFPLILKACANLSALQQGKEIHYHIVRNGFESDVFVGAALVDMYAKCGSIENARQVFDKMSRRDLVSWTAMISGYSQNGHASEALALFDQMQLADETPDPVTLVSVLSACTDLGALQQGKWVHNCIIRSGFDSNIYVGSALIDMYAKCGSVKIARQLFDKMSTRNVVSWSAMIAGYGMHGQGEEALALFSRMLETGLKPNYITFVAVLSACSHAGLVDEGWKYFECMSRDYGIKPRLKHYACIVDLLGRAGHLNEARDFIKKMPLEPDAGVWGALLSGCRIHGNIELGEHVAERLFELNPEHSGYYVLLSNIYAAAGRWDDVVKVRAMMKDRGVKKRPGRSMIEVDNRVHEFIVGDRSHPQSEKIYATLETLSRQMEEAGYVPDTNFVLHDVEEEVKEHILCSHSEKLAIAFGLISTSPGTTIRITKNLRVCGDCHSATKFISKIVRREIILSKHANMRGLLHRSRVEITMILPIGISLGIMRRIGMKQSCLCLAGRN